MSVRKGTLWEVDLMTTPEYKIKHKYRKNMLISAHGCISFRIHFKKLPISLPILSLHSSIASGNTN